jgi:archaemetzincin
VLSVHIVPIYLPTQPTVLADLATHIGRAVGSTVLVRPLRFDPEVAFDASRGQYKSTMLLEQLLAEDPSNDARLLGVAGVDLFIPILTYVFGEAQLGGRVAVASTARLHEDLGLHDERRFTERVVKESVHEIGHAFRRAASWSNTRCGTVKRAENSPPAKPAGTAPTSW